MYHSCIICFALSQASKDHTQSTIIILQLRHHQVNGPNVSFGPTVKIGVPLKSYCQHPY